MSPAARRPPAPVRRAAPAPARRERDPDEVVQLPATGPAAPQAGAAPASAPPAPPGADRPAARPAARPADERAPGRAPAREGRSTGLERAAGARRPTDPAARRARHLRVAGGAVLAVALLVGAGWALLVSPLTALDAVVVTGATRTGDDAVRATAADQLALPLLRVDTGAVEERVEALPWVASARVERRFPHAVAVVVTERTPVAAVPAAGGGAGVELLDGDGATITTADAAPEGVPLVQVDVSSAGAGAVRAASAVALALPASLREQVVAITATGPDDVRLALRSGQEVRWGGAGDDALKTRVAQLLLGQEGVARVDVSAPLAPATA